MRKFLLALSLALLTTVAVAAPDDNLGGVILHESRQDNSDSDIYRYSVTNTRGRIVCVFIWVAAGGWGYTMGLSNAIVNPGERTNLGWVRGDQRNTGSGYEFRVGWKWAEKGHIDCP